MRLLRKHWLNALILVFLVLLIFPQTSFPIKVFLQKVILLSPSELPEEEQSKLSTYHWPLKDIDGNEVNFLSASGEVVVVNLWATWCPPCVAELPAMQMLYDNYQNKVSFYFITAEDSEPVQSFLEKEAYKLPVYFQSVKAPTELQAQTIPTTYIIDHNGQIVVKKTGAAAWDSPEVAQILDGLLTQKDQLQFSE